MRAPWSRVAFIVFSIAYPCLVFLGLVFFKASPRVLSLVLVVVGMLNLLAHTRANKKDKIGSIRVLAVTAALSVLVAAILITNSARLVKAYPIIINAALFVSFAFTLLKPPSMIFRFASIQDKSIPASPDRPSIEAYCAKVTVVWCGFFIFNAGAAAYTIFFSSDLVWSLYNGLISYILIGVLFLGELVVRRRFQKRT